MAPAADDPKTLVSTAWLAQRLGDPSLRILDASWHLASDRDAMAEFRSGHIPGAQFFDIEAYSDKGSHLPHMAPTPDDFAKAATALGIGAQDQVVIYDASDVHSAARVWWTFRLNGFENVAVLDGGLTKWQAEGRALDTGDASATPGQGFVATHRAELVKNAAQVAQASASGDHQIIDARAAQRFTGAAAEPRPGLRSGHIPGAKNLPFGQLFNGDGTMKSPNDLRAAFDATGVDLDKPLITTCGSGVTAAVLTLALARIGHMNNALYDGSWAEWGSLSDLPIATGDDT